MTKKKAPLCKMTEGSGLKPGIIGLRKFMVGLSVVNEREISLVRLKVVGRKY